jgi:acetyltransferase-like isoleucine patch superfamily enzyme
MPITESVSLGKGVKIFHPSLVNLYGCSVGDETKIGAFVEVQKGAAIGVRCKISSHTFICEGVTIEDGVFIGHGVMFTNDPYPYMVAPVCPGFLSVLVSRRGLQPYIRTLCEAEDGFCP